MLTSNIICLQEQGKRYGLSARLYCKVGYIWLASSDELTLQSTLFRFTYMIDTFRTMGWIDWLVSAKEWEGKIKLAGNICAIYSPKDEPLVAGDKSDGNSEDEFVVLWAALGALFQPRRAG